MFCAENLFLTITTTLASDWRQKTKDIDRLNLKSVALFPTCLEKQERDELYNLLEKTKLQTIPFVHLREEDMGPDEIKYLTERWNCQVFNLHAKEKLLEENFLTDYRDKIYVENGVDSLDEKYIAKFAGICLDFAHLENDRRLRPEIYSANDTLLKKYKIGCAHVSAITNGTLRNREIGGGIKKKRCDLHLADEVSQFDYLKNYSTEMFPDYIALELENSLAEQLQFKHYISNLFK